ncbi:MAG: ribosome-recycling factor [Cyanobium sp. MAG06]|nr:ribosome-recycling factor [Cyanobium sp. MAG06]
MTNKEFENNLNMAVDYFVKDIYSVHTGRANPVVLDGCMVDIYDSKMLISHLASINIEDSRTLFISPFDNNSIRAIEKAINDSDIGLSVSSVSGGIRVSFPALTGERRVQYVKIVKDKLEDARVKVRSIREEYKKEIENNCKEGLISKDDESKELDNMQALVSKSNNKLEELFKEKEFNILND